MHVDERMGQMSAHILLGSLRGAARCLVSTTTRQNKWDGPNPSLSVMAPPRPAGDQMPPNTIPPLPPPPLVHHPPLLQYHPSTLLSSSTTAPTPSPRPPPSSPPVPPLPPPPLVHHHSHPSLFLLLLLHQLHHYLASPTTTTYTHAQPPPPPLPPPLFHLHHYQHPINISCSTYNNTILKTGSITSTLSNSYNSFIRLKEGSFRSFVESSSPHPLPRSSSSPFLNHSIVAVGFKLLHCKPYGQSRAASAGPFSTAAQIHGGGREERECKAPSREKVVGGRSQQGGGGDSPGEGALVGRHDNGGDPKAPLARPFTSWVLTQGSPGVPLEGAGAPRPQCHRAICIQIPSHEYVPAQQVLPGQGKISISTDSRHNALYSVRLWGPCLERLRGGPPGQRGGGRGGGGGGGRALCCILSASCQPCITGDMQQGRASVAAERLKHTLELEKNTMKSSQPKL
ncbi:unnamed protein product [Gadus morhua 'NCC']